MIKNITSFMLPFFSVPLLLISSKKLSFFIFQATNITMRNAPNGSIMFAVKKSRLSNRGLLNNVRAEFSLKLSVANIPITAAQSEPSIVADGRFILNSSHKNVTITSRSDIVDVSAAMANKMKKSKQKK